MANLGTLRITGGTLSGRKLTFPSNLCHPMGERERLALFNSLSASRDFDNVRILDLFAGSGALGIEALSRGAAHAVFVEKNHTLANQLKSNLEKLEVFGYATVLPKNALTVLDELTGLKFDFIFADPPYDDLQPDFLQNIANFLTDNGIFILSNPVNVNPDVPNLRLISQKTYAGCQLGFFTH
ncbi:16S rRNA (guanine(966)-N(2))-methyltransferase RsmD [Candidatus Saccharibacteria bacterium]|nr:16S rRNA (guanine(966)-N(2))-methyltransferase RsmD [Candidatus Saccharibacteria bacterium]